MGKDLVTEENEEEGIPVYINRWFSVFIFHGTMWLNRAGSLIAHLQGETKKSNYFSRSCSDDQLNCGPWGQYLYPLTAINETNKSIS